MSALSQCHGGVDVPERSGKERSSGKTLNTLILSALYAISIGVTVRPYAILTMRNNVQNNICIIRPISDSRRDGFSAVRRAIAENYSKLIEYLFSECHASYILLKPVAFR